MHSTRTIKDDISNLKANGRFLSKQQIKNRAKRESDKQLNSAIAASGLSRKGHKSTADKNACVLRNADDVMVNRILKGTVHPETNPFPAISDWLNNDLKQNVLKHLANEKTNREALAAAEFRLAQKINFIKINGFNCTWDDERLREFAEKQAHLLSKKAVTQTDLSTSLFFAEMHVEDFEINTLSPKKYSPEARLNRYCCEIWWRRQLRKLQAQRLEQLARDLSLIGGKKAPYCSDLMLKYKAVRQSQNDEVLQNLIAVAEFEDGTTDWVNIYEAAQASVSNPVNKAAELMVRMRGCEEACRDIGYIGEFVTLSAPSRFHSVKRSGERNPNYIDGTTPKEAHKYFSDIFKKVRAMWAKKGISPIGYRVVEPHHDGCPHWHMLLFIRPEWQTEFRDILTRYYLADNPQEVRGNTSIRVKFIEIDPHLGSAAGYIAKYITKGVNGQFIDEVKDSMLDKEHKLSPEEAAQRIKVNLTANGIRQFQPIGQPSVSVYRELRRFGKDIEGQRAMAYQLNDLELSDLEHFALEALRRAANEGDWQAFCQAMGGVDVKRNNQKARLSYRTPHILNQVTGQSEGKKNRYGEVAKDRVSGIQWDDVYLITRMSQYKVYTKAELQAANKNLMDATAQVFDIWEQQEAYEAMADATFEALQQFIDQQSSYEEHLWVFEETVLAVSSGEQGELTLPQSPLDLCH